MKIKNNKDVYFSGKKEDCKNNVLEKLWNSEYEKCFGNVVFKGKNDLISFLLCFINSV